jgi:hypothetical protein
MPLYLTNSAPGQIGGCQNNPSVVPSGKLGEDAMSSIRKCAVFVCAALWTSTVLGQQTPVGGPPQNQAATKLGPIVGSPIPVSADKLPVARLKVPAGFKVEVYASGVANARSLAVSDKGTVFVGSRLVGAVYAIRMKDGKAEVKPLVSGLQRPNGVAFHKGTL